MISWITWNQFCAGTNIHENWMMVYEGDSHGLACVKLKINDTFDAKIETYYREALSMLNTADGRPIKMHICAW